MLTDQRLINQRLANTLKVGHRRANQMPLGGQNAACDAGFHDEARTGRTAWLVTRALELVLEITAASARPSRRNGLTAASGEQRDRIVDLHGHRILRGDGHLRGTTVCAHRGALLVACPLVVGEHQRDGPPVRME